MSTSVNNIHRTRQVVLTQSKANAKKFAKEFSIVDQTINGYQVRAMNLIEQTKCKADEDVYLITYYTFLLVEETNTIFAFETGGSGCTASCTAAIEKLFNGVFTNYRPLDNNTQKWSFLQKTKFPESATKVDIGIKIPDGTAVRTKKETTTMAIVNTPVTPKKAARPSTTLDAGLAKRQAELVECDTDIAAIDAAMETLEGGKHVYNSWCDFDEGATDRKANTLLQAQFEKVSTDLDGLIEALATQRAAYVEGRKQIEVLIKANTPKPDGTPTKGGGGFGKGKAESKGEPKAEVKEPKPNSPAMDADGVKKVNAIAEQLRDAFKAEKLRVLDFVKPTAKRAASFKFSRGREVIIGHDDKITVNNGEGKTSHYGTKRLTSVVAAVVS